MRLWPFGLFATLLVLAGMLAIVLLLAIRVDELTTKLRISIALQPAARHGSFSVTAREENRQPTHRRAPAHRPAAPPPNWQLRVARPAPGPQARALFAGAATIPRRGRALRLGPEPAARVRGGARQNSQQLVPRPPDPPPVRDAPPPRALYFAPSLQPRSPAAAASAASAHRAAGRQLLSTQPTGAGRGARLR